MNIGVISTHTPSMGETSPEWLPGAFRGGAELSDHEYLSATPDGVSWAYTTPSEAATFDRVLVTSVDGLSDAECQHLATLEPVVFLHHAGEPSLGPAILLEAARVVIVHTPAHEERLRAWARPKRVELVLSAIDTSMIAPSEKQRFALAASRNHPLKGLKNARIWAAKNDYPCLVLTRQSREKVLEAMSIAEVFVHLPIAFESECRSIIEAVLSGCRIVTNANVGITSVDGWDDAEKLRAIIDAAPGRYWSIVCE